MSDFLQECNDKGEIPANFMATFCSCCKNQNCQRAGWGTSRWRYRMETQEERLFNPNRLSKDHPLYKEINAIDFPSMVQEAMRQEIADRRGDWEIPNLPEFPIVDGTNRVSERATTSAVDEAVQALARAQGRKPPKVPEQVTPEPVAPDPTPAPRVGSPGDDPTPTPENPRQFMDGRPPGKNTEIPAEGIMLEGEVPTTEPPKTVRADPWAPSTDKKISVGGTVVLGGEAGGKKDG